MVEQGAAAGRAPDGRDATLPLPLGIICAERLLIAAERQGWLSPTVDPEDAVPGVRGMGEQELTLEVILNWPALLKGKASSQ